MVMNDLQKASECQVFMAFMIVGEIWNAVSCDVITWWPVWMKIETEKGDVWIRSKDECMTKKDGITIQITKDMHTW